MEEYKYDVCVFGGCAVDRLFYQNNDGNYDNKPNKIAPGGKGSNQAVAASRAGARTAIISRLGEGDIGNIIIENLQANGIDTTDVDIMPNVQNDYSNIYIRSSDKDNDIHRVTGAIDSFTPDMIEKHKDTLLNSKIIVCQLKVPKEVTEELINFCHKHGKFLILTPCRPQKLSIKDDSNKQLIDKISLITCNEKEFETMFNTTDKESILKQYPNKLIVTMGKNGLMYFNGQQVVRIPAIHTKVVDTVGAGDTLCGNLAASLASGTELNKALKRATYASAMKVGVESAQAGMPFKNDLDKFISEKNEELDERNRTLKIKNKERRI